MAPVKRPAARRKSPPDTAPVSISPDALNALTLLVGQIGGKLESHITSVTRDRAEDENDRREASKYRDDIRRVLETMSTKLGSLDTHAGRIEKLEKTATDYRTFRNKLAGGVLVLFFFWTLAADHIKDVVKKVF